MEVRRAVFESLLRTEAEERYANLELSAVFRRELIRSEDKPFFTRLFYGVIERRLALDALIAALYRRRTRLESKVAILLRMGLYQILYMDSVPDHAAVSTTVALSKQVCHAGVSGLINGILRTAVRQKDALPLPPVGTMERLSLESGCPVWLCALWQEQYGKEEGEAIALSTNRIPPLTLRVNTLRTDRETLLSSLADLSIEALPTPSPHGIRLTGACPLDRLTPLAEGLCFVQDEASQRCVEALGAKAGEQVLDVCACPGGKSFSLAMQMENRGTVVSRDVHASKLSLIAAGAQRLGISILRTEERDGRIPAEGEPFDRVLCDVPCSGLGVIAKKPDLRGKRMEDVSRLPALQGAILRASADAVRSGGVLMYSTCTLNKAENEEVVAAFLAEREDFSLAGDGPVTLFPHKDDTDGFFYCLMQRR